ncbi:MAG: hypothetical protein AAB807_00755 [Patescibacteria group bacterium]
MKQYGALTSKILQLLATGYMLSLFRDKTLRKEFSQECDKIWNTIDKKELFSALKRLRLNKFIEIIKRKDNREQIRITDRGINRVLYYQLQNIKINPPKKWDNKWRIVLFDIPEKFKKSRDALRHSLRKLGFIEFQKSVFIYPYSCKDEINFIINFFNIYDYVYYIETQISPDRELRSKFRLI